MLEVRTNPCQNRGSNLGLRGEECLPVALKVVLLPIKGSPSSEGVCLDPEGG